MREDECVRIWIVGTQLPGRECGPGGDNLPGYSDIHVAVQRKNRPAEFLDPLPGDAATAVRTFDCAVEGSDVRGPYIQGGSRGRPAIGASWETVTFDVPVLARTRIAPDASQVFVVDARAIPALRVPAYPDGGTARGRATGRPTAAGFADLAARWEASA